MSFQATVLHFGIILLLGKTTLTQVTYTCRTCNEPWRKVFENDGEGSVIFGRKRDLVQAVLHGARVRFVVPAWGRGSYAADVNDMILVANNICAQVNSRVGKQDWEKIANNAYWTFILICTTGHVHIASHYVGSSRPREETQIPETIVWFVKENVCSMPVYSHSAEGSYISGSKEELARSVTAGFDIRFVTSMKSNFLYIRPVHNIDVSADGEVFAQSLWHLGQKPVGINTLFVSPPFWWFTVLTTNALLDVYRSSVGTHKEVGHTKGYAAADWYADTCWRHAFTNDKNGRTLDGSLATLIAAVENGHRVRVVIGRLSIEVDNVQEINGQVSAQLLNQVSKSEDKRRITDTVYWNWQMVHTTGTVRTKQVYFRNVSLKEDIVEKKQINWFVDTRKWTKILSTNQSGHVTFGRKSNLRSAIYIGASVRIGIKFSDSYGWYVIKTDNVEFGPGEEVAAQALQTLSMTLVDATEFKINDNPYRKFIMVSTQSNVDISRWRFGKHTDFGHYSKTANVNWFVNY